MPTVAFHTLGCKVNHYETEAIWQLFKEAGYERRDFEAIADVYVINTCTVTNTGDKKSRQVIRRAIRKNPDSVICVTGCYAQTAPAEVMAIPGVDIVVGTQDRKKMLDYIEQFKKERQPINGVTNIMKARVFEEMDVPSFTDRTRASLKIQEGCNNFCTFCIIPWARGLMRSRDPKEVIKQAQKLVDAGYKEIVLTGIHTGGYGEDLKDYNFAQLLRDIDSEVKGLKRLRISSIEASQITDEVIEVLKTSDKIVRHLHIPLQSGSNSVLKRMRRKYTTEFYAERLKRLREALPGLAVTSDVIVGFPGETEEEFMETYNFVKEHRYSELHVFPYSKRTGTPAARMENQVDEDIKNERVHRLIALSDQLAKEYASKFEGQVLEVIPEEPYKEAPDSGKYEGYTDNYLKVVFPATKEMVGKIVKVKLTKAGYPYNEGQVVRIVDEDYLQKSS
ncbi:MAG: tRNA (N(6)-L-threonylcarbamoyladenosine(37)-C(2))-methylthiotransferase MtaB [Bacillaceae bacterium]|jgi:threonylcarbamoyladenosine tRNA methylthiotransferase MtaB|uniref:tRNA (N(6)-L-threonylcarbamoyladenosine(37)-C(2))-methylthiotransferase n=1 Tax=Aeribacillus composti TaxID=1868734 RepID=A0ABY9WAR4_9BACI|nr:MULTISPECIES: tRNA (N(6)-L-threonylcarbamoyladenosine(37)-C(2))-methylthiotransferase MtaB [Aeribacillus]REJ21445.1 MAG: tRNA (N(6)-L-threonylcarbamoyladenosine(37)-C(2))-methylthiotransferase MtaB [Bacillaceae bacterium]KZM54228.1 tRNA (N(6)-L-threonylcarbamoyladenosine(37)-C(2))-methylthiotransferase MtaB [Aeribacillus pallidus]MDR9792132.1 tRNA (N(6)-L-threonylcarbamoyladenosine(37)-C(2))-methylthiotransferase MtaB [Aeribacillus pallidus]MDR9795811.1 tRNA (N(6)-L-threonylcarbamoyladenosin